LNNPEGKNRVVVEDYLRLEMKFKVCEKDSFLLVVLTN